jgi:hypothetical protein
MSCARKRAFPQSEGAPAGTRATDKERLDGKLPGAPDWESGCRSLEELEKKRRNADALLSEAAEITADLGTWWIQTRNASATSIKATEWSLPNRSLIELLMQVAQHILLHLAHGVARQTVGEDHPLGHFECSQVAGAAAQ